MSDDPRVECLLDELANSHATPEEVCRECPDLLPTVRDQWRRIRQLDAGLNALFPPRDAPVALPPDAMDLPRIPGYEVDSVLGRGGMGIVFRARHLGLNRLVALKMTLDGAYAGTTERDRFKREAEAAAALRHPNVVPIYDIGDADGRPYFTMELVDGGSLAQQLAGTPQPPRAAAELMVTLSGAVQAAHAAGIAHRDLKPGNVLLTTDGTPKIGDFGLARRLDGRANVTQTGLPVGTPSYMAPEQVQGKAGAIGPVVDVYALGAILYELLTGRPPFAGETAAETMLHVTSLDPVPPTLLNPKVPRDLKTICLKCLHKEPQRRYGTAAAFAEDVSRFLRGEPILARRAGPVERLVKWTRRHKALAASIVIGALLVNVVLGVAAWDYFKWSARNQAVNEDFDRVVAAQTEKKWDQAKAALEAAKARLGGVGPEELRRRADQLERELVLAEKLEDILLDTDVIGTFSQPNGPRYEAALREAGIFDGPEEEAVVAARIRATGVAATILEALDGWVMHERDGGRRAWLLEVARLVDENPASWKLRDAKLWENRPALEEFARSAPLENLSVSFLHFLGIKLNELGGDAIAFYRRVHRAHTTSCLANEALAYALYNKGDHVGSLPYFQAAVALRPTLHRLRNMYGAALRNVRKWDLALVEFEEARRLVPDAEHYNESLGRLLLLMNRPAQAERVYRRGLETQPNNATYQAGLALSLLALDRHDEAIDIYRRMIAANPKGGFGYRALKDAYLSARRWDEGRDAWKQYLATNPHDPHGQGAWEGYAELCLYRGDEVEYRRVRTELLKRFGNTTYPQVAERTGQTCLLLPASDEELKQASALIDRALAADQSKYSQVMPHIRFSKAVAEYRAGRFEQSLSLLDESTLKVFAAAPHLLLAMVQYRLGKTVDARKTLDSTIAAYEWDLEKPVNRRTLMICYVLRREAEAVLTGKP